MTAPLATLDVTGSFRVLSNANTALTSGSGVDIIYSGGGQLSSGTRGVAGALTAATMNYAAAAHTFMTGTAGSTNALTIGMDQTCITHGDQWTVGNVGGANSSGNWATLGQNMYFCGGFGSQTTTTVNYKSCCISWNGQYVLFTVTNAGYGPYFSNNGGRSLSIISPAASNVGSYWGSAMSASGQYILVANTTTVWLSSNYLPMNLTATFSYSGYTSVLSVTSTNNALAMSSSGQYCVFAYTASATTGGIYLSSNYGVTWALVSGTNYPWTSVSMSSSGQYITACCNGTPNNIYISSNWGASFSLPTTSLSAISNWVSVKVSASAQWQVACANSAIYYSSNYGVTWTAVGANITLPSGTWGAVAISPNGRYMTATNNAATSYIFTNSNYGVGAWTQGSGTFEVGYFLAMSATGTLAIVSNGGAVLMSALTSTATPSLAPSLMIGAHPSVSANAMLTVNSVAGNGVINLGTNAAVPVAGFFGGAGDKLILYPGTATAYPYSKGISSSTMWNSVPSGAQYQWFNNGTVQMTLNSSGNLGIGTTTVNYPLQIGTAGSIIRIGGLTNEGSAANTTVYGLERSRNQIQFSGYRDAISDKIGAKIVAINKQTYGSPTLRHLIQSTDLAFFTVAPDTTDLDNTLERMRITDTGNSGIGTAAPTSLLHVNGTSKLGGIGTAFKSVVAFVAPLGAGGAGVVQFTVSYPSAYTDVTKLIINVTILGDPASYDDTYGWSLRTVSTTSFILNVKRVDATNAWGALIKANVVVYELP